MMNALESSSKPLRHAFARVLILLEAYLAASVLAVYLIFFVVLDSPPYGYSSSDYTWLYHAPLSGGLAIMLILGLGSASLPWSLLGLIVFLPVIGFGRSYIKDTRGEWPLWLALYSLTCLIMCGIAALIFASATVS